MEAYGKGAGRGSRAYRCDGGCAPRGRDLREGMCSEAVCGVVSRADGGSAREGAEGVCIRGRAGE